MRKGSPRHDMDAGARPHNASVTFEESLGTSARVHGVLDKFCCVCVMQFSPALFGGANGLLRTIWAIITCFSAAALLMTVMTDRYATSPEPWTISTQQTPLFDAAKPSKKAVEVVVASQKDDDTTWLDAFADWPRAIYVTDDPEAALKVPINKGREGMVYLRCVQRWPIESTANRSQLHYRPLRRTANCRHLLPLEALPMAQRRSSVRWSFCLISAEPFPCRGTRLHESSLRMVVRLPE